MKKRVLSIILSLVVLATITVMPVSAHEDLNDIQVPDGYVYVIDYDDDGNVISEGLVPENELTEKKTRIESCGCSSPMMRDSQTLFHSSNTRGCKMQLWWVYKCTNCGTFWKKSMITEYHCSAHNN